jgi:LCP family protein required for cell wall assembly
MGVFAAGAVALIVTVVHLGRAGLLRSLVSPDVLLAVSVACVLIMIGWVTVIMWTYVATEPGDRSGRHQVLGVVVCLALSGTVAVPLGTAADLANTQRVLLDRVFADDPAPAAATPDRSMLPQRLNVLLLGTDAGPDRTGARTDTIIVASVDTRTAATTLFALPRNIEHAPFPPGSPAATRFPDGFHDRRAPDSGDYLLNSVAEYGRAHPELTPAGPTADRGVNLLLSSVSTMLGLPLRHYVAVDMDGLAALIDALGGVTVDVGPEPLPIGGVTYDGERVTPDGYVPAGVQHLDGKQALWFARSRRDSDDYDRMARQRCLIGAVLAQKRPADVVARFRTIAAAAAASITTNLPPALLPALLDLADEHRPLRLRSVSFDPDLPDPTAENGRFDPADPDVGFMRRVVRAALTPPTTTAVPAPTTTAAPAPTSADATATTADALLASSNTPSPAATAARVPAPALVAASCTARS